jgi:hypothetical protein
MPPEPPAPEPPAGAPPGSPSAPVATPAAPPPSGGRRLPFADRVDPRLLGVLALVVVGVILFLVLRGGSDSTKTAATTPAAPPATTTTNPATPAPANQAPAPAAGWTRITSPAGNYSVDVPPQFQHTARGALVTFAAPDHTRAYAVNGLANDSTSLRAAADKLAATYAKQYRLDAPAKITSRGTAPANELRIRAKGTRKDTKSKQRILAALFRPRGSRSGIYIVQGFSRDAGPGGIKRARAEFELVRRTMRPS